eukprot:5089599-Prorocentrum_lima.AAC.1
MSPMNFRNHGDLICLFTFSSGFPFLRNSMEDASAAFFRFSMTLVRCVSMSMSLNRSYSLKRL